jgi:nitrogen-specific signal transduction histidine kinase/response regulator RpfG family c-di-GMP phosphodiesterase
MNTKQINIALVCDDLKRINKFCDLLKDPPNKIISIFFNEAIKNGLLEEPLDLVIVDCYLINDFNYSFIEPIRMQKKLAYVPFIFILNSKQDILEKQIYKNPHNQILLEPFDKFIFISLITSTLHLGQLERRIALYEDIVEGEKKLISYMDELLEMSRMLQFEDETGLVRHLQTEFLKRIELSLAVETALYALYDKDKNVLSVSVYDEGGRKLIKKYSFYLEKTLVKRLLNENFPQIFEKNKLSDPFILELEESLGFKLVGLLFIPITVFHQPCAGLILINKVYRNDFTENDLAFSLIAAQKITFHLESIYLKNLNLSGESNLELFYGKKNEILTEWKLYNHIMESVNFGTIVVNSKYKIHYLNKAACEILHITLPRKSVKNLHELFQDHEFIQIKQDIENSESPIVRRELQLKKKNIPTYYIGYSIYPFNLQDSDKKYIIIFSEISQTKRIQAEIIRMDRMASMGILSSGIAHEIRNPLAGIKAMAQTMEEELENDSPQFEYIERIIRQVNRLDDLLKAFFSYAKPVRPDPSACHIKNIIKEVTPLFKRKMREENIKIQQSYAANLYEVFVDSNQIEQVFLNLFLNAFEAMSDGGKLTITTKNAERTQPLIDRRNRIPGLFSNHYIEISITDTGSGIPKDIKDKIFNPFFTTKSNGTGLGLSIVYQIIREHGGQIDIQSVEGKGTTFIILLPAFVKNKNKNINLLP